ncbi:MAG: hypothetical protein LN415_01455 [Candidatus Thermoplasmatota archaeon]|nr:hypothetical protein [Candidatus Thermoplasmatota archaeon]
MLDLSVLRAKDQDEARFRRLVFLIVTAVLVVLAALSGWKLFMTGGGWAFFTWAEMIYWWPGYLIGYERGSYLPIVVSVLWWLLLGRVIATLLMVARRGRPEMRTPAPEEE